MELEEERWENIGTSWKSYTCRERGCSRWNLNGEEGLWWSPRLFNCSVPRSIPFGISPWNERKKNARSENKIIIVKTRPRLRGQRIRGEIFISWIKDCMQLVELDRSTRNNDFIFSWFLPFFFFHSHDFPFLTVLIISLIIEDSRQIWINNNRTFLFPYVPRIGYNSRNKYKTLI